jgi:amidase
VVKTEFYNHLKSYLARLTTNPHKIKTLEDVVAYNLKHTIEEGGIAGTHPAWPTGQDNFDRSLASKGAEDDTYQHALAFIRKKSREEGIDAALSGGGSQFDALLVPVQADGGVACQVAAKAGMVVFSAVVLYLLTCVMLFEGYPMITVPVGVDEDGKFLLSMSLGHVETDKVAFDNEGPFGLGIIHTRCREDALIKYGSAIEDLVEDRPRPQFRNLHAKNYMYVGVKPGDN